MKILTVSGCLGLFTSWLLGRGCSKKTIGTKKAFLLVFVQFQEEMDLPDLRDMVRADIICFLDWMKQSIRKTGKPFKETTRVSIFTAVNQFFLCLYENQKILSSPAETVRFKRSCDRVKEVLTEENTAIFLDSIDIHTRLGIRDRVLFELIYSSGLRSSEATHLDVRDYDPVSRLLWIHQSKFSKDRRVPVTKAAAYFLDIYLKGVKAPHRPLILSGGYRFTPAGINNRFKLLLERCGLYWEGLTVHSLRHGCATHLLAHGAEIRYVQELLGHESVETTVGYSHQNEENIKAAYRQFHPRENYHFAEITDAYLSRLDSLVSDSLKQREKNRKALARRMSK